MKRIVIVDYKIRAIRLCDVSERFETFVDRLYTRLIFMRILRVIDA